jgi:hypothetical protein
MEYGEVDMSAEAVAVVATGPSLRTISPQRFEGLCATVIAVNAALRYLPRADAFFTCDPSPQNRGLLQNRRQGVQYFAAVPPDYGLAHARCLSHTSPAEEGVTFLRRVEGSGPWHHRPGLSQHRGSVHTGNSAYGALGLAYHMSPQRIALFGVDGDAGKGYAWNILGRPNDLTHLPMMFRSAVDQLEAAGIEVLCASPSSRVDCFQRVTPAEALSWLG